MPVDPAYSLTRNCIMIPYNSIFALSLILSGLILYKTTTNKNIININVIAAIAKVLNTGNSHIFMKRTIKPLFGHIVQATKLIISYIIITALTYMSLVLIYGVTAASFDWFAELSTYATLSEKPTPILTDTFVRSDYEKGQDLGIVFALLGFLVLCVGGYCMVSTKDGSHK